MRKEIFERNVDTEIKSEPKLDLSLLKKRGDSKTFRGYCIQKMKEARKDNNLEVVQLVQHFYKKYLEFEKSEKIWLDSWKGKSSIKVIEGLEKFIVITFQKLDQDSLPEEVKREISKEEVNLIVKTINELNKGEPILTRDIGERTYKKDWDLIFADRFLHTQLNLILRILDYKGMIRYRGRKSVVLKTESKICDILHPLK